MGDDYKNQNQGVPAVDPNAQPEPADDAGTGPTWTPTPPAPTGAPTTEPIATPEPQAQETPVAEEGGNGDTGSGTGDTGAGTPAGGVPGM